jgi:hypothetical protein
MAAKLNEMLFMEWVIGAVDRTLERHGFVFETYSPQKTGNEEQNSSQSDEAGERAA